MVIFLSLLINLLLLFISIYFTDVSQVLSHMYKLKVPQESILASGFSGISWIASEETLLVNTTSSFRSDPLSNMFIPIFAKSILMDIIHMKERNILLSSLYMHDPSFKVSQANELDTFLLIDG